MVLTESRNGIGIDAPVDDNAVQIQESFGHGASSEQGKHSESCVNVGDVAAIEAVVQIHC